MSVQIQLRRDTASNWTAVNPILASGETGVETDTLKFKIGNGTTAWNSLSYAGGTASTSNPLMNGTASAGSSTSFSRGDHVHPTDTSKQDALISGTNIKTINSLSLLGSGNIVTNIPWQSVQTANFTAVSNNGYPVNTTSGNITVTLPLSPAANDVITLLDYAGKFDANSVALNPNGNKINGSTATVYLAINRESVSLVYIDATQGWIPFNGFNTATPGLPYSINYLQVAGGGAGGTAEGGGGGAGGLTTGSLTAYPGQTLTITVGAGGVGTNTAGTQTSGSNSSITLVATASVGGGYGSSGSSGAANGGSGGGAAGYSAVTAKGLGTSGQGNNGGLGSSAGNYGGGGGGGAGAVGSDGSGTAGGAGGTGTANSITGSSIVYAGGGGGSIYSSGTAGAGGNGGGGAGSNSTADATSGTANTGGGGGGGFNSGSVFYKSGNGGSGVIILSVPTANYSGKTTGNPTISTNGANTIIKFTTSGSYTG